MRFHWYICSTSSSCTQSSTSSRPLATVMNSSSSVPRRARRNAVSVVASEPPIEEIEACVVSNPPRQEELVCPLAGAVHFPNSISPGQSKTLIVSNQKVPPLVPSLPIFLRLDQIPSPVIQESLASFAFPPVRSTARRTKVCRSSMSWASKIPCAHCEALEGRRQIIAS